MASVSDHPPVVLAEHRVRSSRVADQVAARIRELIISGALSDGDRLPPIDALMKDFGVSGPSIREALRILESEGLVTVQRGSTGGAIVHRPDAKTAAYIVALVLSSRGIRMGDVLEATAVLEPVCAMLCAQRPDRHKTVVPDLRRLTAAAREGLDGDHTAFVQSSISFHETLVQRCGSETITLVAGILETIWFTKARQLLSETSAEVRSRAQKLDQVKAHEAICDLIEAGEDFQVHQMMTKHIHRYRVETNRATRTERVIAAPIRNNW